MDNAQKASMIGVGLFITIIIIAAVMLITGMGQDLLNTGTQQLSSMSSQLERQLTASYDGRTMRGSAVLSAVQQHYNHVDLVVAVNNGGEWKHAGGLYNVPNGDGTGADGFPKVITSTQQTPIASFSDRTTQATYIVTTANYKANLIRVNDAVVGISFIKQ